MTSMRLCSAAALVVLAVSPACKKEGFGDSDELPADFRPHPAAGDPAKLVMPALLASVPADTPYLFASVDALPPELLPKLSKMFAALSDVFGAAWRRERAGNRVLDAILSELDGKWNQAGLESLGFSGQPRFALYGLGLQPMVARVAIRDEKAMQATIERIATKAGESLPPVVVLEGRSFWQHEDDGSKLVVALADKQLVLAFGKTAEVDARLRLIVGVDKPAKTMADGALLKQLMVRHGLGGQLIGFGDTGLIVDQAIAAAGASLPAACKTEIARLTWDVPRVVYGYGEMSGAKVSGGLLIELSPDGVGALRSIKVEIPGLAAALAGQPMLALAGGVDLTRAQQLAIGIAGRVQQLGTACEIGPVADGAARAARAMAGPLPDVVAAIAGGAVVVDDLAFPNGRPDGMPSRLEGVAMVSSRQAHALYDKINALDPQIKSLAVATDGKLHAINVPVPVPSAISLGVSDRAIVAIAGERTRATAERLLAARGGGKAPLLAATYDVGAFLGFATHGSDLESGSDGDAAIAAMLRKMKDAFGHLTWVVDVTEHGLAMWSTIELR